MPRKQITVLIPELYDEILKKLKLKYKSRNNAITIAVKRLLQYEARVGHLNFMTEYLCPEKRRKL